MQPQQLVSTQRELIKCLWCRSVTLIKPLWFHSAFSYALTLEAQYHNIQCRNSTGLIKVIILHLRGCHSLFLSFSHTQTHTYTHCLPLSQLYDVNNPIRPRLSNSLLSWSAHKAGNIHTRWMMTAGLITHRPCCLSLSSRSAWPPSHRRNAILHRPWLASKEQGPILSFQSPPNTSHMNLIQRNIVK